MNVDLLLVMKRIVKTKLPVLPLRDLVVFPGMIVPLFVGRDKSVKALEASVARGNSILLVAQKDPNNDSPASSELYNIGVVGQILQILKLNDNTLKVLVEGKGRVKVSKYSVEDDHFIASYKDVKDLAFKETPELLALRRSIYEQFENYVQLNSKINPDVLGTISTIQELDKFADVVSSNLMIKVNHKQESLETTNVGKKR